MAKKRRYGGGGVNRRNDGRWEARFYVDTPQGRKRRAVYGKTRKEAAKRLDKALSNAEELPEDKVEDSDMTFGEFLNQYEAVARSTMKRRSFDTFEEIARLHLIPALGSLDVREISRSDVQDLYTSRLKSGLSASRVRRIHGILNAALNTALEWDMVEKNVCREATAPRVEEPEIRPLNVNEVRAFLEAARGDRFYAFYVLGVTTGMRFGELGGLYWSDIDLGRRTLRVSRSLISSRGVRYLESPKTSSSRRNITLGEKTIDALEEHRESQRAISLPADGRTLVFTNTIGGPINASHVTSRSFKPLLKKAELPDTNFHAATRHTCCSLLLASGVNVKAVSLQLGHSSVAFTLQKYAHLIPGFSDGGAMDRLLDSDRF